MRWQDVERLDAAQNYVRVHANGAVFLIRTTLQALARRLSNRGFVQVHRSMIVNVAKIKRLFSSGHGDFEIELSGGDRVALGRRYRGRLEEVLGRLG